MAHRALIAYELNDGSYYVVHSRWGAIRLEESDFDPSSPFGDGYVQPGRPVLDKVQNEFYSKATGYVTLSGSPPGEHFDESDIENDPRNRLDSLSTVIHEQLNFLNYEAFFVVDADWNATRYRTLWTNFFPEYLEDPDERANSYETIGEGVLYHTPTPDRNEEDPDASVLVEKRQEYEERAKTGELTTEAAQEQFREWLLSWNTIDPDRIPAFSPYSP